MVKKLFKYEFLALGRILLPFAGILPVMALLSAVSLRLTMHTQAFEAITGMLAGLFLLFLTGFCITAYVLCIVRFYRSLFSREGYFTLSLPVTGGQLLFAKAFVSIIVLISAFIVTLISAMLFVVISVHANFLIVLRSIGEVLFGLNSGVLWYGLFCLLLSSIGGLLFIFACLSAGQMVSKHRILLAVVIYLVAGQVLSIPFSIVQAPLLLLASDIHNTTASFMLMTTILILQPVVLGIASVFFIRWVLKNKVNIQA